MILNDTQSAIRDMVQDFAQTEIRPRSFEFEREGGFPPTLFERMAELGLLG